MLLLPFEGGLIMFSYCKYKQVYKINQIFSEIFLLLIETVETFKTITTATDNGDTRPRNGLNGHNGPIGPKKN